MTKLLRFDDFINESWKVEQSKLKSTSQNSIDRNVISKLFDTTRYFISDEKNKYSPNELRDKFKAIINKQNDIYFDKVYKLLKSYGYKALNCLKDNSYSLPDFDEIFDWKNIYTLKNIGLQKFTNLEKLNDLKIHVKYTHSNNELKITCGMYDNVDNYDITDTKWGKDVYDVFLNYPGYVFLEHNHGELVFNNFELYWDENEEELFNVTYKNCLDMLLSYQRLSSYKWCSVKDYKKSICKNKNLLSEMFHIFEFEESEITIHLNYIGSYHIRGELYNERKWFNKISKLIRSAKRKAKSEFNKIKNGF